ncbi:hypothetical protein HN51_041249 [Arachis hypogaea]
MSLALLPSPPPHRRPQWQQPLLDLDDQPCSSLHRHLQQPPRGPFNPYNDVLAVAPHSSVAGLGSANHCNSQRHSPTRSQRSCTPLGWIDSLRPIAKVLFTKWAYYCLA